MLERQLIEYCSPTLASIKTANMFTCSFENENTLWESVDDWNRQLAEKGIFLSVMRIRGNLALIYVCRFSSLARDMKQPGAAEFLRQCGYRETDPVHALGQLRNRLETQEDFPHEIGLFLGYPLGDVVGFMVNGGKNYKCRGLWKVYTDAGSAVRIFEKYRKCKDIYGRLWKEGRTVGQLTVAA